MNFSLKNILSQVKTSTATNVNRVVGIDVGSSSIKVVELEQRDDYIALVTYGELQLGPYMDAELGAAVNATTKIKIQALVDVLRESAAEAKHAVVAIPLSTGFVTIVPITNVADDTTLDARVKVEARKYVPVPLKEVSLEWVELPPVRAKQSDEETVTDRNVLIAAVHNDSYAEITTMLNAVEITSQPTEMELFCLQRVINDTAEPTVLIDFGASATRLYIFQEGYVRKIHRMNVGSAQLTNTIAQKQGISFKDAEALKYDVTDSSHEAVRQQAIATTYTRVFAEINRALQHYEQTSGSVVTEVYCSGGGASMVNVVPTIATALNRQCVKLNCFEKVAYPAFMEDTLSELAPSFSVALGAALRELS